MDKAMKRAAMPAGTNAVLDRRTVYNANKNLLDIIQHGQTVLDVGCGSGTITKGISELVKENGAVIGLDPSLHLIDLAKQNFEGVENLKFIVGDINSFKHPDKFDVITSARTLQWLANPKEALKKMLKMLKTGGVVSILDYNHEKIEWSPDIPDSMRTFYKAFLRWREDAGMDNAIADNLENIFERLGLKIISVTNQDEFTTRNSEDAEDAFSIWTKVAETRGKQLVAEKYITETLRLKAIEEYSSWVKKEAVSMKLYMRAVTGYL